jgi:Fe-S-cluster containining protein
MSKRKCGKCTECCSLLEVANLPGKLSTKPKDTPCLFAKKGKCNIYASRPQPCREFKCLWLHGLLDENHRPDKTKIVVYPGYAANLYGDQQIAIVAETQKHAFESQEGLSIKRLLSRVDTPKYFRKAALGEK